MATLNTAAIDQVNALGQRLRETRLAAGLLQADLAGDGCTVGYISRIEAGQRSPSLQVVRHLAARLGVTERWLETGEEESPVAGLMTLLRHAEIALSLDDVTAAETLLDQASPAAAEPTGKALLMSLRGRLSMRLGYLDEAIAQLEAAVEIDPENDDLELAAALGIAYSRAERFDDAATILEPRLERATADGDLVNRLRFGVLLANALVDDGERERASVLLSELLSSVHDGDPVQLASAYWMYARLSSASGETEASRYAADRAVDLLESAEHTYFRAKAHELLAICEVDAGQIEDGLSQLERARELVRGGIAPRDTAELQLDEARALARAGRPHDAADLAASAAKVLCGEVRPSELGRCYMELAIAFDRSESHEAARRLYQLAISTLENAERPTPLLIEAYRLYGGHLERHGMTTEALAAYKQATESVAKRPSADWQSS